MHRRQFISSVVPLTVGASVVPLTVGAAQAPTDEYYEKYWQAQAHIDALEAELARLPYTSSGYANADGSVTLNTTTSTITTVGDVYYDVSSGITTATVK